MTTKLTLTIEKSVIQKAKLYAGKTGRSLSDIVESYLEALTKAEQKSSGAMSSNLKKLYGSVNIPKELNHKTEIRRILSAKK